MNKESDSYIKNCVMVHREKDGYTDMLFPDNDGFKNGKLKVTLDGYAIVPLEDFDKHTDLIREHLERIKKEGWDPSMSSQAQLTYREGAYEKK